MTMKRSLGIGALIIILLVSIFWTFRAQIGAAIFSRAVDQAVQRDVLADLGEGMHVVLCGTGSPLADPSRTGPCNAVIVEGRIYIVDIGGGAVRNLGVLGLPPGAVETLLLTHFHSDHFDGMGELLLQRWAGGGHDTPLPVIGPEGVEAIVDGLNQAYAADSAYRIAHHGENVMPPSGAGGEARPFALPAGADPAIVHDQDGLRISAFAVDHSPVSPAVGYRFDYQGRSAVFSGDTKRSRAVERACDGCDIIVHEVLNAEMVKQLENAFRQSGNDRFARIMSDIPDYHTSPKEVAETAESAGARMLVFSHIVPAVPLSYLEAYYLKDVGSTFGGEVVLGRDGMVFTLPANKNSIERAVLP